MATSTPMRREPVKLNAKVGSASQAIPTRCESRTPIVFENTDGVRVTVTRPTTHEPKVDTFTKMLRLGTTYLKLDPMALPDQVFDFMFFGRILLLKGSVAGLGSVSRTGANIIRAENGTFSASVDVGTEQLYVNYTAMITAATFNHLVAYMSASVKATRMTLTLNHEVVREEIRNLLVTPQENTMACVKEFVLLELRMSFSLPESLLVQRSVSYASAVRQPTLVSYNSSPLAYRDVSQGPYNEP
ncbi:hypothetical protein HPB51_024331 [Rhipicephalus microplus]|uniref:Uncharacterized protein n=1 Tax=Rhipicephalus microplus TaxID=6941 RepID=A0A9J6EJ11_RHIMP|nr:hypothetical protein HPB51_024331 [Rhipicephalus microplus]